MKIYSVKIFFKTDNLNNIFFERIESSYFNPERLDSIGGIYGKKSIVNIKKINNFVFYDVSNDTIAINWFFFSISHFNENKLINESHDILNKFLTHFPVRGE